MNDKVKEATESLKTSKKSLVVMAGCGAAGALATKTTKAILDTLVPVTGNPWKDIPLTGGKYVLSAWVGMEVDLRLQQQAKAFQETFDVMMEDLKAEVGEDGVWVDATVEEVN